MVPMNLRHGNISVPKKSICFVLYSQYCLLTPNIDLIIIIMIIIIMIITILKS